MSVNEKMTAIADAIREKTGGTEPLTLDEMATEIPNVYGAGIADGIKNSSFWDAVQDYGNRTTYYRAFSYWNCEYLRPKYKVIPNNTTDFESRELFRNNTNLKIVESEYFDLTNVRLSETSTMNNHYWTFQGCKSLERVQDIGMQAGHYEGTFRNCAALKTIDILRVNENTKFSTTFHWSYGLENITIDGIIGQNGLDMQYCTNLSHDSLMSIINALKDYSEDTSGTTWLVTLGSTNVAKLTEDELNIITQKGWTYK